MSRGPLDHPRLLAVERKLDAGQLEEAQHLLAQLGDSPVFRHGVSYLATRLLYQRGTLDTRGVVQRLETLLAEVGDFPEARALLDRARSDALDRRPAPIGSSRPPAPIPSSRPPAPIPSSRPPPRSVEPEMGLAFSRPLESERPVAMPVIPRGARVPEVPAPGSDPAAPARPASIPDLDVPGGSRPPPGFAPQVGVRPARAAQTSEPVLEIARPASPTSTATRYSACLEETEHVALPRRAIPAPEVIRRARTVPPDPEPIVSDAPPPVEAKTLSLFEIAHLLDDGRAQDALEQLARSPSAHEPDHVLMQARVLHRLGRNAEAHELVARLSKAPLVEPEVRAGVARLAAELGEVELAIAQARRALDEDPAQPLVRLSFALAGVRHARHHADAHTLAEAAKALREVRGAPAPHEALRLGLAACIEAHAGDPREALELARRSLEQEENVDALAALAMASARLGRAEDVRDAGARLRRLSPREAQALEASLARHGEALFALVAPDPGASDAQATWGPLELALVEGRSDDVWTRFAQLAADTLAQVTQPASHEPAALAAIAASFFTVAPISRDFAPYDDSPPSLRRLEAVLDLVAGSAREVTCRDALPLLAGCYLGEGLRRALGLGWRGTLRDPDHARVEGSAGSWRPILLVAERLAHGHALGLEQALERARPRSDHPPTVIAARPPCPWDPAPWPAPSRLPAYARALRRSVIGVWCKKTSGLELDGSVKSLAAIDAWLELVAPASSPPEPASARRVIVLAGAYLGETLREATGGRWLAADDTRLSPDSYVLDLGPGEVARPIEHAFARVTRGGLSFGEYAARWIERVR